MASSNNDELISKASPHTVKKFELVEAYITDWSQKLMNTPTCNGLWIGYNKQDRFFKVI